MPGQGLPTPIFADLLRWSVHRQKVIMVDANDKGPEPFIEYLPAHGKELVRRSCDPKLARVGLELLEASNG